MKRLLLLLVSIVGCATAQNYDLAFQNTVATGVSPALRGAAVNQFHQLTVIVNDVTAGSCSAGWTGSIFLEGSQNQVNYTAISLAITAVADGSVQYTSAFGAFQYVRVNYQSSTVAANCLLTAWYSGTTTGYPTSSQGSVPASQIVGNNSLFNGQLAVTATAQPLLNSGGITSAIITPTHAGTGYAIGDIGTISGGSGTASYVVNSTGAGGSVTGFSITNPGTAYAPASNVATTATTGAGTGLHLTIQSIGFGVAQVCVKADIANTINVYVGSATVTVSGTTGGIELGPDEATCLPVANLNIVNVIASTTGATVSWAATKN